MWLQLCNHPDQDLELFWLSRRLLTPPQVASVLSFVVRFVLLSVALCEWNPTECAFGSGVLSQLSLCETHRCCVCNIILFPHCVTINFFYFHKISKEGEIVLEGKRQMHVLWGRKPFVFSSKTPLPLHLPMSDQFLFVMTWVSMYQQKFKQSFPYCPV